MDGQRGLNRIGMKLSRLLVHIGACASLACAGVVKDHGALQVKGNRIVNASGEPIQVAGMSMFWPQWEGSRYYTVAAVNTLVKDWGSSLVRAPMPVFTTNSTPNFQYDEAYIEDVKRVVQAAIDADIYVIIDWHLEGDHPQLELSKQFFGEMARLYGKYPNVIFEIWNEPIFWPGHHGWNGEDGGWSVIKSYTKEILGVIRPHSSNLVIVGTGYWSSQISAPMNDPVSDPNLAYALHFNACYFDGNGNPDGRNWAAQVAKKIPLFATEWGTTKNDGTGKICLDESDKWLAMFKENGISWAAWSFSHQGGLSAALNKGQGLYSLTQNGTYLKGKIQEIGAQLRKVTKDTTALPGRITAANFANASAGLKAEPTTDEGGGWNLGYSADGSWAEYTAKVAKAGKYELQARVATANSGKLTFSWKGTSLGSIDVQTTGGWQKWATEKLDVQLDDVGVGTFRVTWSGSAQGLVNLNWIDLAGKSSSIDTRDRTGHYSVRSDRGGVTLAYPAGTDYVVVADVRGTVVAKQNLSGSTTAYVPLDAQGMVFLRFFGAKEQVVLTQVLPSR